MKTLVAFLALAVFGSCVAAAQQTAALPSETGHVVNNLAFMSPGEKYGLKLTGSADGAALSITEEPDLEKADVVLSFEEEKTMMLFTIENRTKYWLSYEAGIRVPKRDGLLKTSVLPVEPHLTNFESWPHPIEQLAMKNFRLSKKPAGKATTK